MQAAKDAVKNFTSKHGHHDTTVHENVAPAVQNETITKQNEERVQTAVDKEVHQDHYHTSVQPVKDREVLPEQHHHQMAGVEERKFEHDDPNMVQEKLAREQAQFKNTQQRVEGQTTSRAEPTAAGEHTHHHVHETIQPVVQKDTIEPHVVHTTVPIHETHHNAAQHHATSALPAVGMDEFKKHGGSLTGRETRSDQFEGCPKPIGNNAGENVHTTGVRDERGMGSEMGRESSGINSAAGAGVAGGRGTVGEHDSSSQQQGGKPSMMDKLNPKKDADNDGKAGMMS